MTIGPAHWGGGCAPDRLSQVPGAGRLGERHREVRSSARWCTMRRMGLAERLLSTMDWSSLRELQGNGEGVGKALADLLGAEDRCACEDAYWRIENHAVAQGELFEVAEVRLPSVTDIV